MVRCECGTALEPRRAARRFCSRRCASRWSHPLRAMSCPSCGAAFDTRTPTKRFCSRACCLKARAKPRRRTCPVCDREFGSVDARQRFCSVMCANKGKRRTSGDRAHNWKGGRTLTNGYVRLRVPEHPRASRKQPYVFEHVVVMEAILGRRLRPNERVHHRNGRRDDNRPENLELWRLKDPPGVRASDYHCPGCQCSALEGASRLASSDLPSRRGEAAAPNIRAPRLDPVGKVPNVVPASTGLDVHFETQRPHGADDPTNNAPRSTCPQCRRQFTPRSRRQRCCSRTCARRYERVNYYGGHGPGWKGGRVRHSSGYIWVSAPHHPRARRSPYVFEHILVVEKALGGYLEPNKRIHHRNGQRNDNRPENLELWRLKDPPGIRAADYHCSGCTCERVKNERIAGAVAVPRLPATRSEQTLFEPPGSEEGQASPSRRRARPPPGTQ